MVTGWDSMNLNFLISCTYVYDNNISLQFESAFISDIINPLIPISIHLIHYKNSHMGNQNNKQHKKNQTQIKVMKCPKCQMVFQHSNVHEVFFTLTLEL